MEDIIKKIKNLLNKSQDAACSPAEAATCVVMAQKLLAKYGLDMADVTAEDNQIIEDSVSFGTKSVSSFQALLAKRLSDHFGCEVIISRRGGKQMIGVIGEKVKVVVFKDVLVYSYNAYQTCWKAYHSTSNLSKREKIAMRGSYMEGFITGIVDEIVKSESSTALVVRKSQELYDHMDAMDFGRPRQVGLNYDRHSAAYIDGVDDGRYAFTAKNKAIHE